MKYNGQELTEITEPQLFNPPKEMLVWDETNQTPHCEFVCAVVKRLYYPVITIDSRYEHCAEIPKPNRVTNLQLMEWLAKGNGAWKRKTDSCVHTYVSFFDDMLETEVEDFVLIRPFGTTEWLEPTLKNMGMEE